MQRITKIALLVSASILATNTVLAQSASDIMRISDQNYGIGTARSAAMGGAFTSLGADPISMSLNPAGIAMYKSGEVSVSPAVRIANSSARYSGPGGSVTQSRDRTRFNLGNAAAIYSNGKFAVGFGMNRLADFNGRTYVEGYNENVSIGQMFAEQLFGINKNSLGKGNDPYRSFANYPPSLWGGILGYRTGMVDPYTDNTYTTSGIFNNQYGDLQRPAREVTTTGGIYEYNISGGGNIGDWLYIGGTLGVQDIYYTSSEVYTELADIKHNTGALDNMIYRQNNRFHGSGVNLKVGVTARPLDWLRIGVSYHSPTWIGAISEYDADMTVYDLRYKDPGFSQSSIYAQEYDLRTPSRLLAGVSATIGGIAILSADYERTWYGSMKYTSPGYEDLNRNIKDSYTTRNTFRFGAEVQPINSFFIRAGYRVSFDQGQNLSDYKGMDKISHMQFSGGVGYRNRFFSLDLAYVYYANQLPAYKLFSYTASDGYTVQPTGTVYTTNKNQNIIMTLAFRF